MLDEKSGYALIPGASRPDKEVKMRVKVIRNFWHGGELIEKGTEDSPVFADVPDHLARELVASNKAELAPAAEMEQKPEEPAA